MVTGHAAFVSGVLDGLGSSRCVIVGLEVDIRKLEKTQNWEWTRGSELIASKELHGITLHDHCCGGATDGRFQFGSGHTLVSDTLPWNVPDVQHSLGHHLRGRGKGHFKMV